MGVVINGVKHLGRVLTGNTDQLMTAKDYRIASQRRVHAGKMLLFTTPLAALGAVTNSPSLMIPAFYIPAALLIPAIDYFLMKTVPTGKRANLGMKKAWLFNPLLGLVVLFFCSRIYHTIFVHQTQYQAQRWAASPEAHIQANDSWQLIIGGLAMAVVCGWLAWTLMKGRRTQSMQRIAAHLAAQEAENA